MLHVQPATKVSAVRMSYLNPYVSYLSWNFSSFSCLLLQMYNLYSEGNLEFSGLSRSFLFRRLEPWTVYTLTLEACTSAGCTRIPPQRIATAAAPPASQSPPRPLFVGSDQVSLTWGPPSQPNGPIKEYFLLGRRLEEEGSGRSKEEDIERGKVGETLKMSKFRVNLTSCRRAW